MGGSQLLGLCGAVAGYPSLRKPRQTACAAFPLCCSHQAGGGQGRRIQWSGSRPDPPQRPPLASARHRHCHTGGPFRAGPALPGGPAPGSPPRPGDLAVTSLHQWGCLVPPSGVGGGTSRWRIGQVGDGPSRAENEGLERELGAVCSSLWVNLRLNKFLAFCVNP